MGLTWFRLLGKLHMRAWLNWTSTLPAGAGERRLIVPILGSLGGEVLGEMSGTSWKPRFFQIVRRLCGDAIWLDVGANLGQTLLQCARAGPLPQAYVAFEPNPLCAAYLQRLVSANHWGAVQVFPCALAARSECRVLELAREDDASASMVRSLRVGRQIHMRKPIACFRLDELHSQQSIALAHGFFMKIDVEGAEAEVLAGAEHTVATLRPLIQCEVLWAHSDASMTLMRARNAELVQLLHRVDYALFRLRLDASHGQLLGLEPVHDLPDGLYARGRNSHQCDYLFAPRERVGEVVIEFSRPG